MKFNFELKGELDLNISDEFELKFLEPNKGYENKRLLSFNNIFYALNFILSLSKKAKNCNLYILLSFPCFCLHNRRLFINVCKHIAIGT